MSASKRNGEYQYLNTIARSNVRFQYAVEYKPALGEPYRPVLSAPSRLSSLLPEWSKSGCIIPPALFNGVDPPRALKPAEILTPRVTQSLPPASVATAAAPASGIRTSEPRKTPISSTRGDKDTSTLSDPETKESGSEVSDPSSSDPKHANPEDTAPKASDSEDPSTLKSDPHKEVAQDIQTTTPGLGKGAVGASQPKTSDENFDPKPAALQPSDPQDISPQALDEHDDPEKAQSSNSEVSKSDDSKSDSSNPNHFQPSVLDSASNTADSSKDGSENLSSHNHNRHPSNSISQGVSSLDSQGAEAVDPNTDNVDSSNDESKSKGKVAGIPRPNKSQVADLETTSNGKSDLEGIDGELDPFYILPSDVFSITGARPPSARLGDGEHFAPNNPKHDPSSRAGSLRYHQPTRDPSDEDKTAKKAFTLHDSNEALPTKGLDAMVDRPSRTAPTGVSNLSPQHAASDLPPAISNAIDHSPSRTATADDSTPVNVTIRSSQTLAAALSSASVAAPAPHSSIHGPSGGEAQAENSGTTLLASRKLPTGDNRPSVQELLYRFGVYLLPWLLILL